ncbi:flavin-containing monooxygenase 5-like [Physella acuta]|uniref:flavin-containing monooxygenase 5-like n=1 Tax=Physella acuta TaxID=109671 RepID=UPI0027DC6703|nr:flavin-containing monooxygenase 5-like [Physella acuta]
MKKDIAAKERALQARYVHTDRHTIQVDWLPYMDELAELTGCKPNLVKLLLTDPPLFWRVLTGPGVPYQYRLHGPNPWPGARQAIFTVMDRIRKPFETRQLPELENRRPSLFTRLFVTSALVGTLLAVATYRKENLLDYIPHQWTVRIF